MKSLLVLRNIKVENANCINGMTYGFPAISHFLGFTHALSRRLEQTLRVTLGGCAVVSHQHQFQTYSSGYWGDQVFALTRNPLTREEKPAPFVEEGRMHMEVSLLIECNFEIEDIETGLELDYQGICHHLEQQVLNKALMLKLAGGHITEIKDVNFYELDEDPEKILRFHRQQKFKLLPGFALVERSELLRQHWENIKQQGLDMELMDAWLDFFTLQYQSEPILGGEPGEDTPANWSLVNKPEAGWFVPLCTGYRAVSPLYSNSEVARTRDAESRFQFVEPVHTVGQWISPHQIGRLEDIFWRYEYQEDWYLCRNHFKSVN